MTNQYRAVDDCTMPEFLRREALPRFVEVLREQVRALETTMRHSGPVEICVAIDTVELTLRQLRELTMREEVLKALG